MIVGILLCLELEEEKAIYTMLIPVELIAALAENMD